jgi:hypothetical protein
MTPIEWLAFVVAPAMVVGADPIVFVVTGRLDQRPPRASAEQPP